MSRDYKQSERELIYQDIKGVPPKGRPRGEPKDALAQPTEHSKDKRTPSDDPPVGAGRGK